MGVITFLVGIIAGFLFNLFLIEKTGDTLFGWIMEFLYRLKK